jgi:hypothetical protein
MKNFIPRQGTNYSHTGNMLFPRWEYFFPRQVAKTSQEWLRERYR